MADEEALAGGNATAGVVRVGGTVRRPAGPWTPAVHASLTHLHAAGFTAAPRPLGIDERGREVLSYVPGRTVWPDRFDLMDPAASLARVGRLVRRFHDAAAGFTPPPDARWQRLVPDEGADLVVHHDLAPWNLVAGDDGRWTLIDWDTAGPGSRLWDLAYALHGFVPLSADPALRRADAAGRVRRLVDAYGLDDEADRRRLVPMLARRTRSMYDLLRRGAEHGTLPWARLWAEGHGAVWAADTAYVEEREAEWSAALLG